MTTKIFIGGLDYHADKNDLLAYFEKYGKVVDAVVMMNTMKGGATRSRGFGFVKFDTVEAAKKVMDEAPHTIGPKTVEVKLAVPKDQISHNGGSSGGSQSGADEEQTTRLFVGGLGTLTTEDLMDAFESDGAVSADIMKDKSNGNSRGFGFVTFENSAVVDRLAKERRRMMKGRDIEMKKAVSVSKMRTQEPRAPRNQYDDYGRSYGGGPMRNRSGFRDNSRQQFNSPYNSGGPGPQGYGAPQGWSNYQNQYSSMGGSHSMMGGAQGPHQTAATAHLAGYNTSSMMASQSSYGGAGNYNVPYPVPPPSNSAGATSGGGDNNQMNNPLQAFHQLQQAVQNYVVATGQQQQQNMSGYGQSGQQSDVSGYQSYQGATQNSLRSKQTAPYFRGQ